MRDTAGVSSAPHRSEIALLFQGGMLIFIVTVVIGMLNGMKIIKFERNELLTHVHAGTIGWITLGVLAFALILFGAGARDGAVRPLSWLAVASVPFYVYAFWANDLTLRAVFSLPVLVAIAGFFAWSLRAARRAPVDVAGWALLGALFNVTVGAVIGSILQWELATKTKILPEGAGGAHPETMLIGFLIIAGMALAEAYFRPGARRLGLVQVGLPFVGSLAVTGGALTGSQIGLMVSPLTQVAGIALFVYRIGPRIARVRWLERGAERHFGFSGVYLVVNVALLVYLIAQVVTGAYGTPPDFFLIPPWLIFAFAHGMFIGVISNALFGLVHELGRERARFWAWADDVLFWGMNFGMLGFVASLALDQRDFERVFTPIMGGSILVAILVHTVRLRARPASAEALAPA